MIDPKKRKKFNFDPETGEYFDEEFDDFSIMEGDFDPENYSDLDD